MPTEGLMRCRVGYLRKLAASAVVAATEAGNQKNPN